MNAKKLAKIRGELASMRRTPQRASDLQRIAEQLGRRRVKRGKHPMWESEEFELPPLSIPNHGGRDIPTGTKNCIVAQLEDDLLAWEERLMEDDGDEGE